MAYLDASETDVHILQVDPSTFTAVGTPVTVTGGKEAGGLVAQNDGFALLTNIAITGVEDAPPGNTPVPVIIRYQNGAEAWRTFVAGPQVHPNDGLSMAPDLNGDLVYSEAAGYYGAYCVVTDYTGPPAGHFGDSIEYVTDKGNLTAIQGASSSWGCSHNTGIAFEAADQPPYASICAEDHGSIWLNTKTRGMSGQKIAGENTTNGASGEPMGGMSGSYSALASFPGSTQYIFAWATRGCVDLTQDTWMGSGFTQCLPRTMNHNVAISLLKDKQTMAGPQAISTVGAASGDDQLNLVTSGSIDRSNVHVATFDGSSAMVTWEEIASPTCKDIAMGCSGKFTGSYFQAVDSTGAKKGDPVSSQNIYVAGDIVNIGDKLCWPYVNMAWDLSQPVGYGSTGTTVTKMSIGCMSNGGSGSASTNGSASGPNGVSSTAPSAVVTSSSDSAPASSATVSDVAPSLSISSDITTAAAPVVADSTSPAVGTDAPTIPFASNPSETASDPAGTDTSSTPQQPTDTTSLITDPSATATPSETPSASDTVTVPSATETAATPSSGSGDSDDVSSILEKLIALLAQLLQSAKSKGGNMRRHARDLVM